LQRQLPPWSISVMGQIAALAALSDAAHAQRSLRFMARERERLKGLVAALPGCSVLPTYANYFLMELPRGWRARETTEQLRNEGLLVRDCSSVPGCNTRSIRLAVRSQQDNDRLIQALSNVLHHEMLR
jgi:threonine-phosphate decarboxylase